MGRNASFLLCVHTCRLVHWDGGITPPFPCCSSQALEPSLRNRLPIPHPQHLHLLDHLWKQLRGFSFHQPGATGFPGGFLEGQAPGKPAWSFLPCRETVQVGTHPWPCLPDRDTSQGLLCTDSYNQCNEKLFQQIWLLRGVRDTDCAVGKCTEKLGGSWIPVCPWAAVDCEPLFHCANMLFSLHGSGLGTSDVSITGWGSFSLKPLQSAHHNMHLLWQLVYPSLAKMSMNYFPCDRIPLPLLTFHQRLGLPY